MPSHNIEMVATSSALRHLIKLLRDQIHSTLQVFKPVKEIVHHAITDKGSAMLRHDHGDIEIANHLYPQATYFVRDHVAFMEADHFLGVTDKILHATSVMIVGQ